MRKLLVIVTILCVSFLEINAQILVGNRIDLVSSNPTERKVSGLNQPTQSDDAVNLSFFISGKVHFCNAMTLNSDTMQLSIYPDIDTLVPGTLITFISSISNDSSTFLKFDNGSVIELTKKGIQKLDSADIIPGMVVSAVYDGNKFQCISDLAKNCPIGFIKATEEYCIQQFESDSAYFWKAIQLCGDMNARVCNWGEWYYACENASTLGLTGMLNNFEWVDGGGNSLGWTVPPTSNTGLMSGSGTCINIMASIVDTTHNHSRARPKKYHCCYSLK